VKPQARGQAEGGGKRERERGKGKVVVFFVGVVKEVFGGCEWCWWGCDGAVIVLGVVE